MPTLSSGRVPEYLELDLEVGLAGAGGYPVAIIGSPAGEARGTMQFPLDEAALAQQLQGLTAAVGAASADITTPQEQSVQAFGRALMDALLSGELRATYDTSLMEATRVGKRLRVRLRVQDPQLAALPWEFLYDARIGDYVTLTRSATILRYLELPEAASALSVTFPLRMLAIVSRPNDLPALDTSQETGRIEKAVSGLVQAGLLELTWVESGSWRELQRAMAGGPWHIFHFIGHGGFAENIDEGVLAFVGDDGGRQALRASQVGRLLADHPTLRLVVLNACQGAEASKQHLFASTAATLVQRGIPAVVAMQYEISDPAAIEFSRGLYEALAAELPVEAAVSEARIAVSVALHRSFEWGTPVLFMRATNGVLFRSTSQHRRRPQQAQSAGVSSAAPSYLPDQVPQPVAAGGPTTRTAADARATAGPAVDVAVKGYAATAPAASQVTPAVAAVRSMRVLRSWKLRLAACGAAIVVLAGVGVPALMVSRSGGTSTSELPRPPVLPTVAPPEAGKVNPYIGGVHPLAAARQGKQFRFEVVGRNGGAAAGTGAISVSSPDQTELQAEANAQCAATPGRTVPGDPVTRFRSTANPGQFEVVYANNQLTAPVPAVHSAAKLSEQDSWKSNEQCTLIVTVPDLRGDTATFYLRMTVSNDVAAKSTQDANGNITYSYPYTSYPEQAQANATDQQDLPVIKWTVKISK